VPNTKSAIKRNRQNLKRRLRNRIVRGRTRSAIKKARQAIQEGDLDVARQATTEAIRALDKAGSKGVFHKNNVSRRKSRLIKYLGTLEQTSGD
jgi:small subunit ribosomal protein S20